MIGALIQRFVERKIDNAVNHAHISLSLSEKSITNSAKLFALNLIKPRKKLNIPVKSTNMRPYKQGVFKPKNGAKFDGAAAVYRSSYELKFFRWCDENVNVIRWGSENIVIPYINPNTNKFSRYFVDNFIVLKEGNKLKKYLIEIKPKKQTMPPDPKKYRKKSNLIYEQAMYAQNSAKWVAANEWAKKHGAEFIILTEKELNI
jgi:hypothetical protein